MFFSSIHHYLDNSSHNYEDVEKKYHQDLRGISANVKEIYWAVHNSLFLKTLSQHMKIQKQF